MIGSGSAIALSAAVGLAGVGMVGVAVAMSGSDAIVVSRVVDGDTVDVKIGGRETRIRLLNIDTPETVDPKSEVQCLGPEATKFLASLLPPGTPVTLEYDKERTDRYDRTLAGVFTADGALVNAEIARAGLGHAVVVGQNKRFFAEVEAAQGEARSKARGLYSSDVGCTVPAQVDHLVDEAEATPAVLPPEASSAELSEAEAIAATSVASAVALRKLLEGDGASVIWLALPDADRAGHLRRISQAQGVAQRKRVKLHAAFLTAQGHEAARVAAADAARVARLKSLAAESLAARQAEAARNKATAVVPRTSRPVVPNPPAPNANPYPGYTGPRCYAPGGKTWKPC